MNRKAMIASLVGVVAVTQAHALLTFTLLGGRVSLSGESVATHESVEIGGSVWDYFQAQGTDVTFSDWQFDLSGLSIHGSESGVHTITDIAYRDASGSWSGSDKFYVTLRGDSQLIPGEVLTGWGSCFINVAALSSAIDVGGYGVSTATRGAPFALVVGEAPEAVNENNNTLLLIGLALGCLLLINKLW